MIQFPFSIRDEKWGSSLKFPLENKIHYFTQPRFLYVQIYSGWKVLREMPYITNHNLKSSEYLYLASFERDPHIYLIYEYREIHMVMETKSRILDV